MTRVAFVGLGKMGLPMALHLQRAGHAVAGLDALERAREAAQARGLEVSLDDDAALAAAEVVVSSVPDDAALRVVGARVASRAARGALYIDTSTVSAAASAEVAARCAHAGLRYLRVAVSGNAPMAEASALSVLASGAPADYAQAEPLLACWGPKRHWLGEGEQARVMKLVVNLIVAHTAAMLAEALALGVRGGLSWQALWAVLPDSAIASPLLKAKAGALSQRDFTATFTVEQMQKDVSLVLAQAADTGVPLPLTGAVAQALASACGQGDGALDYAALIRAAERAAGLDPHELDAALARNA